MPGTRTSKFGKSQCIASVCISLKKYFYCMIRFAKKIGMFPITGHNRLSSKKTEKCCHFFLEDSLKGLCCNL